MDCTARPPAISIEIRNMALKFGDLELGQEFKINGRTYRKVASEFDMWGLDLSTDRLECFKSDAEVVVPRVVRVGSLPMSTVVEVEGQYYLLVRKDPALGIRAYSFKTGGMTSMVCSTDVIAYKPKLVLEYLR